MAGNFNPVDPNPALPQPFLDLEEKRRILIAQTRLGHEQGNGAPCRTCYTCPGLDLHYWRRRCKICRCKEEDHEVLVDDSTARFEILMNNGSGPYKRYLQRSIDMKITETENPVNANAVSNAADKKETVRNFKWVPADIPDNMVEEYMSCVLSAHPKYSDDNYRRIQMARQVPLQDVDPDLCIDQPQCEREEFLKHLNTIRQKVVGQGRVRKLALERKLTDDLQPMFDALNINNNEDDQHNRVLAQIPPPAVKPGTLESSTQASGSAAGTNYVPVLPVLPSQINNMTAQEIVVLQTVSCAECGNLIKFGSLAVMADRIGTKMLWHPQCFVCCMCKELLVDLVYFSFKRKIYCGRDYCIARKNPRCTACDELIFEQTYTFSEGFSYHNRHMVCISCEKMLHGEEYVRNDASQPVCLPCYTSGEFKKCDFCLKAILFDPSVSFELANEGMYHLHVSCFKCAKCRKPLKDPQGVVIVRQRQVWCSEECSNAMKKTC